MSDQSNIGISIVAPIYNASGFLADGIESIRRQTFKNWELIAVDDGSTDNSKELLHELTEGMEQKLVYHYQENGGGFAARNTGLDLASGKYIAFFDCDDTWYPDHLMRCYQALEREPDVDWVFAANRIIDLTNDTVMSESNFYEVDGTPRPVLGLKARQSGDLFIIEDSNAAAVQLVSGLNVGQQFSLIRREVFDNYRFRASYRNEGADQVSVIRSLVKGFKFAYLNEVHGTYCVHNNNASAGAKGASLEKYLRLRRALIRGFEELREEEPLPSHVSKAVDKRNARIHFWDIGYNLFWKNGRKSEALDEYRKGLKLTPADIAMWKTYFLALFRPALESKGKN